MYVVDNEPAIWQEEGAGVEERDLISGEPNRSEAGRYMGDDASYKTLLH